MAGMHDHASRFVDDHDVIILEHDIQVEALRLYVEDLRCIVGEHDDLIPGSYLVIRLYAIPIDEYHLRCNGTLQFVPGDMLHAVRHELVYAYRFLPFVNGDGYPLIQFLRTLPIFCQLFLIQMVLLHSYVLPKVTSIQRNYLCHMATETILFRDLLEIEYGAAWELQEGLLRCNLDKKAEWNRALAAGDAITDAPATEHHLLFCEHPPVYTLGKSGKMEHVLIDEQELARRGVSFYHTNRGGDITYHGPGQIVGYPIFDLERFFTDIGRYLRSLEEVVILTMAEYGLKGGRSIGETGVWMDQDIKGKERKICAMGVRCSRWVTMHGFAFNVNTDLSYFDSIIPCGIRDKQVTSMQQELGFEPDMNEVKGKLKRNMEIVFGCSIVTA